MRLRAPRWLAVTALLSALPAQVGFVDASTTIPFDRTGGGLGGAAWLDYDLDGDLDLFLPSGTGGACGLFRNDGGGAFSDVAVQAGLDSLAGFSAAVAGDLDNDGDPDLFLSGDGSMMTPAATPCGLFRNNGDGTFSDVIDTSGIQGGASPLSAALGDLDNDGLLDLFICSSGSQPTKTQHPNQLYRNNGNLTFTDISASSGVDTANGACAVAMLDYDRDGDQDIMVAVCHDAFFALTPFELFRNNGDLTFTDVSAAAGVDLPGFWMSVTPGDYDNDGDVDVFATNSGDVGKEHALLRNNGDGTFTDVAEEAGLTQWEFGWGASFLDVDNDADLDLFFAGSLPVAPFHIVGPGVGNPGRLLYNQGDGTFAEVAGAQPVDMSRLFTTGVAQADYDGDGFADVVVVVGEFEPTVPAAPILLRNRGNANHWLGVRLVGSHGNRGGVGALIEVTAAAPTPAQVREVRAGSSFLCSETPWPVFGLNTATQASVRVNWPSGLREVFAGVAVDRYITLQEGTGEPEGSYVPFGVGCPGAAGVPQLDATAGPELGATFVADLTQLPSGAAGALLVGASKQSWGPLPLPLSLAPLGAPQCVLTVSAEAATPFFAAAGGTAAWQLNVPPTPALAGLPFYNQAVVVDGTAPGRLTLSNAAVAWIGL
ncbi:MAG: CRTAC1 family protein [Planctomycetota bacterium]